MGATWGKCSKMHFVCNFFSCYLKIFISRDFKLSLLCKGLISTAHTFTKLGHATSMHSRRQMLPWLGKYSISWGRNVLLHGNSWRITFEGLSLRFWGEKKIVRSFNRVLFNQTSTRIHQLLSSTHNRKVTPQNRVWYGLTVDEMSHQFHIVWMFKNGYSDI